MDTRWHFSYIQLVVDKAVDHLSTIPPLLPLVQFFQVSLSSPLLLPPLPLFSFEYGLHGGPLTKAFSYFVPCPFFHSYALGLVCTSFFFYLPIFAPLLQSPLTKAGSRGWSLVPAPRAGSQHGPALA